MEQLNFHKLHIFNTVARTGSFTRAAEALGISQPAVSIQVRELERSLKTTLLTRKRTGAELTDAGEEAYSYTRRIFSLSEEMLLAIHDVDGLRSGRLSIGSSSTPGEYILPLAIGAFRNRYPGVEVALDISRGRSVMDRVLNRGIDLGMVGAGVEANEAGLESFVYARDEIALVASPRHPLAETRTLALDDIDGAAFVMRERGSETREAAERALSERGLAFSVSLELDSNEAVKRAAAAGLGIGALSKMSLTPDVALGYLKILNANGWKCERPIMALYMDAESATTAQKAFVTLLKMERPMPPMPR